MQDKKSHNANVVLQRLLEATGCNTSKELSELLEIGANTLSGWKERGIANYEKIFAICELKGISIDWLITGKGVANRNNDVDGRYVQVDERRLNMVAEAREEYGSASIVELAKAIERRLSSIESRLEDVEKKSPGS